MTSFLLNNARKYGLTMRELEVMSYIAKGKTSKQIAVELSISVKTVDNHRTNIRVKTGCHNAVEIALFAMKNVLVE